MTEGGLSGGFLAYVEGFGYLRVRHAQKAHLRRLLGIFLVLWYTLNRLDLDMCFYLCSGSNWLRSGPPYFFKRAIAKKENT
jgi:hypothetical protein